MKKRILTYFVVMLAVAIVVTTVIMTLLTYNMFEDRVLEDLSADVKVIAVLLDEAVLKSADMTARRQTLTVTLHNGLKLQLGVSGDTVCGCGGWSCPEFFDAFEAAL